jgi:hypothetical protein
MPALWAIGGKSRERKDGLLARLGSFARREVLKVLGLFQGFERFWRLAEGESDPGGAGALLTSLSNRQNLSNLSKPSVGYTFLVIAPAGVRRRNADPTSASITDSQSPRSRPHSREA